MAVEMVFSELSCTIWPKYFSTYNILVIYCDCAMINISFHTENMSSLAFLISCKFGKSKLLTFCIEQLIISANKPTVCTFDPEVNFLHNKCRICEND